VDRQSIYETTFVTYEDGSGQVLKVAYTTLHWTVKVDVGASATTIERLIGHINHQDNAPMLQPA